MSVSVSYFGKNELVFEILQEQYVSEQIEEKDTGPLMMNAFELITLSQGLNLSALFDRRQVWFLNLPLLFFLFSMFYQDNTLSSCIER